ncbi:hypothetical protein [Plantactinospora sp. GCM10030261]|uniref:hypothetical protein n=1 Tax=Plantactinospora sp. GCM10030261 TaxID=3273420 RepID=UPI0036129391
MAKVSADLVERLYAAHPEGFIAARGEAAAAARAAGDTAGAKEIGRLKKPTVAAWLVNLLAIRRPELMAELAELAAALRSAQRDLRGSQLRELSSQRRGAVTALVDEARSLAVEEDPGLSGSKLPLGEVEATLNAALSDAEVAEQVRSGRLIRATSYAGFGEVPRPQLRLVTGGPETDVPAEERRRSGGRDADGDGGAADADRKRRAAERARQRRELSRELTAARRELSRAESALDRAGDSERDGAAKLADIEAELAELERRRAAAEAELSRRKLARKGAEREVTAARRRAGEVEAAVEALDADAEDDR